VEEAIWFGVVAVFVIAFLPFWVGLARLTVKVASYSLAIASIGAVFYALAYLVRLLMLVPMVRRPIAMILGSRRRRMIDPAIALEAKIPTGAPDEVT
jgi:hypothetical protein